jgi:dolichol-phosphate mannosyltransferase
MRTCVITPVGNEDLKVVVEFEEYLHQVDPTVEVFFIFDQATPDAIQEHYRRSPRAVYLTHSGGLAECYRAGYRRALESDAEIIIEMDIGHPVSRLEGILRDFETCKYPWPVDVVMAHRLDNRAPWHRRLISSLGTKACQWFLRMPYSDCTGGYIGMRRSVVERLDLKVARGHGHQVELKKQLHKMRVTWMEFPMTYIGGPSSFSWKSLWDGVRCLVS